MRPLKSTPKGPVANYILLRAWRYSQNFIALHR
jgi:hypothetical protein